MKTGARIVRTLIVGRRQKGGRIDLMGVFWRQNEARFISQNQWRLDRAVPACWNCVLGDPERIQTASSHGDMGDVGLDKSPT